jgi:hypothetical protein
MDNPCGQTFATSDEDNAWINSFRQGVSSVPIVGQFVAAFVPPSSNLNHIRCIPGDFHDETSGYTGPSALLMIAICLLLVYFLLKIFK